MDIFNIIGPVMIGPSNSHTASACRTGRIVNKLAGGARIVRVYIQLSGSFTRAYQGYGTDRAVLAGVLGYYSWSEELRNSMRIAAGRDLSHEFVPEGIPGTHPNTAHVYYECDNGKQGVVEGTSIGGGSTQIANTGGMEVNSTNGSNAPLILHLDRLGVIVAITHLMCEKCDNLSIGSFRLSREKRDGEALTMLELGQMPPGSMAEDLSNIKNVEHAILVRALG